MAEEEQLNLSMSNILSNAMCVALHREVSARDWRPMLVDRVCVVVYGCRCLRRLISCQRIDLLHPADPRQPEQGEEDRVHGSVSKQLCIAVLFLLLHVSATMAKGYGNTLPVPHAAEASAADYWFHASRDGSRRSHYEDPCVGATLCIPLDIGPDSFGRDGTHPRAITSAEALQQNFVYAFRSALQAIRNRIEAELPGMYHWFDEASLHVTLRGLT